MNQFIVLTITLPSPITQGETWDELPCEWGKESGRLPRGEHGMSSHVSGGGDKGGAK